MVVSDGNLETERQIITLSQDSFYRNLNEKESEQAKQGMFNFDHPGAWDFSFAT
jgi:uridine kinase